MTQMFPRILIVEDEPLIAMDLDDLVRQIVPAVVIIKSSVAAALASLAEPLDFAFLDVNVTNGDTLPLAERLSEDGVPFAFISASAAEKLPRPLRAMPFLPKPVDPTAVKELLKAAHLTGLA
jgi:CheY-like chemotaxis protein